MALTNYTDLQASIAGWLHRTDLTAAIVDFIALAESRITRDIPERALYSSSNIGVVAGTEAYSLPVALIKLSRVWITDADGYIRPLPQVNPALSRATGQGVPTSYSIDGNQIRLSPVPDASYTVTLDFKQPIPALATNTTNEILTRYPDLYLHACLVEAYQYIDDRARLEIHEGRYQAALSGVVDTSNHNRLSTLRTDLPSVGGFDITTGE